MTEPSAISILIIKKMLTATFLSPKDEMPNKQRQFRSLISMKQTTVRPTLMVHYTHILWNHDKSTPRSKNKLMLMITISKRRLPGNDIKMHRTFLLDYSIKVNSG